MAKISKYTFDFERALSWSSLSSFAYNREQWFTTYILGERQSSKELEFGSRVDKRIQVDPKFLSKLPRYPEMQYKMKVIFGKIPLVGIPDGLCLKNNILADYKTGKKEWTQKRADETGQLTMYLFLLYIMHKIRPEDFTCIIHWLPTKESQDFKRIEFRDRPVRSIDFTTKRTMVQVLEFGDYINRTYKEMQEFVKNHE